MEKKIKNAAVCFSGQAKNFELCYPYIRKNLLDQIGSHDIFCCVEDDENADKIKAAHSSRFFYSPRRSEWKP